MLLERLTICDCGVFRGRHSFDLAPRKKYGKTRPIVLFGGLNGAGKTTLLTGVRLALYGRASLGPAVSQREYSEFLAKAIHRNVDSLVPGNSASVAIEFEHAQLGERRHYRVVRSWTDKGRSCVESVSILQDESEITGLSQEQAQGFLNQLVPPGVSQFFFFDGEKIASLATDGGDQALRDSIRRLLGLDLVERLRGDLASYARQSREKQSTAVRHEMEALNSELETTKQEIASEEIRLREEIIPAVDQAKMNLEKANAEITARGGAWAKDRGSVEERIDWLLGQKEALENRIKECIGGEFPLALAPKLGATVARQLNAEVAYQHASVTRTVVHERVATLRSRLFDVLPKSYRNKIEGVAGRVIAEFDETFEASPAKCIHALGEADSQQVISLVTTRATSARVECLELLTQAEKIDDQLGELNLQLARAPADSSLQAEFDALTQAGVELGRLQQEKSSFIEKLRRQTWQCIDLTRKVRRLEEDASYAWSEDQADLRATAIRDLMSEFSKEVTRLKLTELRAHFIDTFARLARKEDLVSDAEINEEDFSVTLIDRRGKRVPKESLSAGERQIYAIAMLEALAKTSGRNLPVIIDTPLGRLDSKHRQKLVDQYFPHASHQVIVLSTDTEVDEPFYQGLAKHVSHAYHLVFDENAGATTAEEGYFWKHLEDEAQNAA